MLNQTLKFLQSYAKLQNLRKSAKMGINLRHLFDDRNFLLVSLNSGEGVQIIFHGPDLLFDLQLGQKQPNCVFIAQKLTETYE